MSTENLDTRERILRAAWQALEDGPAAAVRMSDIAKRAGISRQAVYLHFPTRAELLIATARYVDEVLEVDRRLTASRAAASGVERLDAWIDAWGNYIPAIYGVARALLAAKESDAAAAAAWHDRMQAVRHGCAAAVEALRDDGALKPGYSVQQAVDVLWALSSVRLWEQLRFDSGWSQASYVETLQKLARDALVAGR
jgi:AcrR family transcriptional regulator